MNDMLAATGAVLTLTEALEAAALLVSAPGWGIPADETMTVIANEFQGVEPDEARGVIRLLHARCDRMPTIRQIREVFRELRKTTASPVGTWSISGRPLDQAVVAHGMFHLRRSLHDEAQEWEQAREPWNCPCRRLGTEQLSQTPELHTADNTNSCGLSTSVLDETEEKP